MGFLDYIPLIGDAINIAGKFLGRQSAKKDYETERYWQNYYNNNAISLRVADAKRAGIHPLAALGFQGMDSPPIYVQDRDFGSIGQNISRTLMGLTVSLKKEQLKQERITTEAMQKQLYSNPNIGYMPGQNVNYVTPDVTVSQAYGIEAGEHPGEMLAGVYPNSAVVVPGQKVQEAVSEVPSAALSYFYIKAALWKDLLEDYWNGRNESVVNFRNALGKDWRWKYNPYGGYFIFAPELGKEVVFDRRPWIRQGIGREAIIKGGKFVRDRIYKSLKWLGGK